MITVMLLHIAVFLITLSRIIWDVIINQRRLSMILEYCYPEPPNLMTVREAEAALSASDWHRSKSQHIHENIGTD